MSIDDENKVDFISIHNESNTAVLTISDHLEWGENEHLYKLQKKINAYLRFIESGEIYEEYPKAKDKKTKIRVVMKYEPDKGGKEFLLTCTDVILSAGVQFTYEVK